MHILYIYTFTHLYIHTFIYSHIYIYNALTFSTYIFIQTPAPRASLPLSCHKRPPRGRPFPLAKSTTPATRASISITKSTTPAIAGVHSPSQDQQRPPRRASIPPRQIAHICRRQMSLPIAKSITSAAGRCLSPSPNLSHLPQADVSPHRHLWRGGGRKAEGEVHSHSQNPQRPQSRASIPPRKIHNARNRGCPFPLAKLITPAPRASLPLAKLITPAPRASLPIAIYGEGVAERPGVRSEARQ